MPGCIMYGIVLVAGGWRRQNERGVSCLVLTRLFSPSKDQLRYGKVR